MAGFASRLAAGKEIDRGDLIPRSRSDSFSGPGALLAARLSEAIEIVESGAQPYLSSEAGRRLARWLRDGGLPHQDSEPKDWYTSEHPGSWEPARPGIDLDPWFPQVTAALIGPLRVDRMLMVPPAPFRVAQLPHHRDEMMARDYTKGVYARGRRMTLILPLVVEADGPAGYAVHLALARGLANAPHGDDATVDALLVLAARGQLDSGQFGRQLETLLRAKSIDANRVADSLRAAAKTGASGTVWTGASGTVWAVLETALPGLLRGTSHKDAAVLLSLAAECVSQCAAKGEIAEVTAVAGRSGSSQTVKNARLLRDVLCSLRGDPRHEPRLPRPPERDTGDRRLHGRITSTGRCAFTRVADRL